mgnify:FL=1
MKPLPLKEAFSRDDLLSFTEKTFDKVKNAANFVVSSILMMKSQVLVLWQI